MMPWVLLNHPAYTKLKPSAAKALPFFLGKPKKPNTDPEFYHTTFSLTYSEGKKRGFAFSTFANCIRNLMSLGFIDPIDKGGLRGDSKSSSLFKLSKRWEKYGTPEFKDEDWDTFVPPMPAARNSRK